MSLGMYFFLTALQTALRRNSLYARVSVVCFAYHLTTFKRQTFCRISSPTVKNDSGAATTPRCLPLNFIASLNLFQFKAMEPQTDLLRKKLVEQFDKGLYCDIKLKAGIDGTE